MSKRTQVLKKPLGKTVKPASKAPVKLAQATKKMATLKLNVSSRNRNVTAPQTSGQRHEKQQKEVDHEKMDQNLKKKSPWYQSLRDPLQGAGAKIPDETGINTACMQLVQKVSVAVNTNGLAGLEIHTPYINGAGPSGASDNFVTSASLSASTTLTWNPNIGFSNATSMKSVAAAHRVVSAALYAEYEGTTLSDSGDVTTYFLPYAPNALTALSAIQARFGSSVVPINKARSRPVVARWFPINVASQSYKDFVTPDNATFGVGLCPRWVMGAIYSGLPSNTGSVIFTMVVNYEFLPTLNTIDFITPTASPIDPIEEQMVQQWTQEDTQTGLASNKMVDVQPGAQVVEAAVQGTTSESGFGMLGGIIEELAPVLLAAFL